MPSTYILGINAYHGDAAAVLLKDGAIAFALEEERLNRIKHSAGFPAQAVKACLDHAGITPGDLQHIAIARSPRAHLLEKMQFVLKQGLAFSRLTRERLKNAARVRSVKAEVAAALGVEEGAIRARLHHVEHHLAHLCSAFHVSPFGDAAILSIDGFGDFRSTMLGHGQDTAVRVLDSVAFPHSLGLLYTMITQFLGFPHYGDEGKVMGLAPYGNPQSYLEKMRRLVSFNGAGLFELHLDYFCHHTGGVSMVWDQGYPTIERVFHDRVAEVFGPPRQKGEKLEAKHADIAAALQQVLEEGIFHILAQLWEQTRCPRLALAGGVAFNSVANGKILERTPFRDIFIQPAAGDAGTALGAALWVEHCVLKRPRTFQMQHACLGPEFSDSQIAAELARFQLAAEKPPDLLGRVARLVADGKVVGWFQGRTEFGPRALGNRSILADPRRAEMKDILNARIKRRESFRPFAPAILEEHVAEWFENTYPSPYMLMVYKFRADKRPLVPAVCHVDQTGRLQTVSRRVQPRYWAIIEEFRKLTGVPILLNTSFNEDEPMVNTPADAIACFLATRMDALVLGDHLVLACG
jgi:carbamoyltransferase